MTSSEFSTQHDPYDENRSSYHLDPRLRHLPEITSYTPVEGPQACRVYVYVRTLHDLLAPPALSISLSFASKKVACLIEPLPSDAPLKQYALSAEVPSFHSTGYHSFTIPLRIVMEGGAGTSAPQAVEVGAFTHLGPLSTSTSHDLSRKRKLSSSSEEALQPLSKRTAHVRNSDGIEHGFTTTTASPYSPFLPTPTSSNLFQGRYQQTASPRSLGHHYTTSSASQASLTAPSPHTPSYSPSFATVNKMAKSPGVSVTPAGRPSNASSPGNDTPTLVRTSTIQPNSGAVPSVSAPQGFNPYAMYPHKASLKLNGDLDSMAENWKLEEWEAKRRLVHFTRRQKDSVILADFRAISPEERQPNQICISCIWWEEKKECFVTSVDTIHLLESLVAVRFTVEEKNRIRRNLEGFRPLTVSKSKIDSDDFFKIIMGFPNPKPRNIEKDVKVFPWKILAHALKKIIGKYVSFGVAIRLIFTDHFKSASYSSTAGALSTPSSYAGASENSPEAQLSPRSGPMTIPAVTYSNVSASFAPPTQMQRMPSMTSSTVTPYTSTYSYPSMPQQPMSAPPGRQSSSWDFSPFLNPNAPASAPPNIQTYNYNRSMPLTYAAGYPTTRG